MNLAVEAEIPRKQRPPSKFSRDIDSAYDCEARKPATKRCHLTSRRDLDIFDTDSEVSYAGLLKLEIVHEMV